MDIAKAFKQKTALIPYITAGDPDPETTVDLVKTLDQAGADIIELGVPFSDPLADGPTIQAASQRALKQGISLPKIIDMVAHIRKEVDIPILLMGYYNSFYNYLLNNQIEDLARAGVSGLIIPDLPFDEDPRLYNRLSEVGLAGILLVAPNTPDSRIQEIARHSSGFLYCVALLGVTGARGGEYRGVKNYLDRVRQLTELPLGLGFGIDGPDKAARIGNYVDGVIVGSALIRIINDNYGQGRQLLNRVEEFVSSLKRAIN